MKEFDENQIRAELGKICAAIPIISTAIVASDDGWRLIYSSKNDSFDEKLSASMGAVFLSVGERLAYDLAVQGTRYFIVAGNKDLAIYIPIGQSNFGLILITPSDSAPDDLWPVLEPCYMSLAKYF